MRPKGRTQYVGNTPSPSPKQKKRKGSATSYKVPKAAKQAAKDKAYIEFQATPRKNKVTADLEIRQICDTILGGRQIWLRGTRTTAPFDPYRFPIIIEGTRCSNLANRTFRKDGKNIRRCEHHELAEFWIKDPE